MNKEITEEEAAAGLSALFGPDPEKVKARTPMNLEDMTKKELLNTIRVVIKQFAEFEQNHDEQMGTKRHLEKENARLFKDAVDLNTENTHYRKQFDNAEKVTMMKEEEIINLKACLKLQDAQIDEWREKYGRFCSVLHDLTEEYS